MNQHRRRLRSAARFGAPRPYTCNALRCTYYDTEDLALRRAGCTLRVRVADTEASAYLTWKGPSRRGRGGRKRRTEVEVPIRRFPIPQTVEALLRRHHLDELMRKAGVRQVDALDEIGILRNERSRHLYVQGLHRIELTWDRITFPVGPDEVRVEVELKARHAERYLANAETELRTLIGKDLRPVSRGVARSASCASGSTRS